MTKAGGGGTKVPEAIPWKAQKSSEVSGETDSMATGVYFLNRLVMSEQVRCEKSVQKAPWTLNSANSHQTKQARELPLCNRGGKDFPGSLTTSPSCVPWNRSGKQSVFSDTWICVLEGAGRNQRQAQEKTWGVQNTEARPLPLITPSPTYLARSFP